MSAADTVLSKGPCPRCGSKDNNVTYTDGHEHCFTPGCGHFKRAGGPLGADTGPGNEEGRHAASGGVTPASRLLPVTVPPEGLKKRGLMEATLRRYGYGLADFKGHPVHAAPYYAADGRMVAQKLRFPDKSFPLLKAEDCPPLHECQLFGRPVFGDSKDRRVVVTEGEIDAMSVAQATDFQCAAVSISTGAVGAVKCLKANYLWLDRFEEIVLWFDDDEPGRLATEECAKLFKVGKVRIAKAGEGAKDASDLLQRGLPGDIKAAIYKAQAWRPRGIVNGKDSLRRVLAPTTRNVFYMYPSCMPRLQEMTGGMAPGDVIYHVAGTGIGKSAVLREIVHCLLQQGVKVAFMSFEDTVREAMLGLMSLSANQRLHLLPLPDPDDKPAMAAHDAMMGKYHEVVFAGGLVELFDAESAEWSLEAIMGYVRYCAKALDCQVVVLEPLSFVAAGIDLTADERRVLDKCAQEFAKLAKELGIHIQISHHLKRTQGIPHEEGAPTSLNELRSSGGLANFAMGVIGWERNQQAAGDAWRVTRGRIIKPVRRTGAVGMADTLYYGEDGRLVPSPIPFPPMGKPDEGEGGERREFTSAVEY